MKLRKLRRIIGAVLVACMLIAQTSLVTLAEELPIGEALKIEMNTGENNEGEENEEIIVLPEEEDDLEEEIGETDVVEIIEEASSSNAEYIASPSEAEYDSDEEIVLSFDAGDVIVKLTADKDAFENKGELSLSVEKVVNEETEDKVDAALDAVEEENVAKRVTYDIKVLDDGEVIEPIKEVKVSFELKEVPSGADGVNIYHHDETEGVEKIATDILKENETEIVSESIEKEVAEKLNDAEDITDEELAALDDIEILNDVKVEGKTDSFSLYTVDFTYKDKTVSINGDTKNNKLDDVVSELGIEEDITEAHAYEDLDKPEEISEGETSSEVKNDDGVILFTVHEENDEWYVDAVNAFDTEHGLVIKTADGAEYKIKVTDAIDSNLKIEINSDGVLEFSWPTMSGISSDGYYAFYIKSDYDNSWDVTKVSADSIRDSSGRTIYANKIYNSFLHGGNDQKINFKVAYMPYYMDDFKTALSWKESTDYLFNIPTTALQKINSISLDSSRIATFDLTSKETNALGVFICAHDESGNGVGGEFIPISKCSAGTNTFSFGDNLENGKKYSVGVSVVADLRYACGSDFLESALTTINMPTVPTQTTASGIKYKIPTGIDWNIEDGDLVQTWDDIDPEDCTMVLIRSVPYANNIIQQEWTENAEYNKFKADGAKRKRYGETGVFKAKTTHFKTQVIYYKPLTSGQPLSELKSVLKGSTGCDKVFSSSNPALEAVKEDTVFVSGSILSFKGLTSTTGLKCYSVNLSNKANKGSGGDFDISVDASGNKNIDLDTDQYREFINNSANYLRVTISPKADLNIAKSGEDTIVAFKRDASKNWIAMEAEHNGRWENDGKGNRFIDYDGNVVTNKWTEEDFCWYYCGSDGYMVLDNIIDHNGNKYYVDSDGKRIEDNWVNFGGSRYYADFYGKLTKVSSGGSSSGGGGSSSSGVSSSGTPAITGAKTAVTPINKAPSGAQTMGTSTIGTPITMLPKAVRTTVLGIGGKAGWTVVGGHYQLKDASGNLIKNRKILVSDNLTKSGIGNVSCYAFDENGNMLLGWQWIQDEDGMWRLYYFNEENNELLGARFMGGTKDGRTLNENGQVVVGGVVQAFATKPTSLTGI